MDIEATETMGNSNTFKYSKITRHSAAPAIEVTKVDNNSEQPQQQPEQKKTLAQNPDESDPHPDAQPPMPKEAAVQTDAQQTATPEAAPANSVPRSNTSPAEESFVQLGATTNLGSRATARTQMKVHKRASGKRSNPHYNHVPNDEMDLLIETVNSGDFGWKADVCMLQKHHHMYDADNCEKK